MGYEEVLHWKDRMWQ